MVVRIDRFIYDGKNAIARIATTARIAKVGYNFVPPVPVELGNRRNRWAHPAVPADAPAVPREKFRRGDQGLAPPHCNPSRYIAVKRHYSQPSHAFDR
jgi:hypothetical protein